MKSMKVVVGLGNPGNEYDNTRHNVGFEVVEALLAQISKVKGQSDSLKFKTESRFDAEICKVGDLLLVKPHTYMNESGRTVSAVMNYYKVDLADLWLVHDDLDIVMGEYKVQFEKGPKIHGGVNSIEETLGKEGFWRVRIGVDNRSGNVLRLSGDSHITRSAQDDKLALKSLASLSRKSRIPGREYVLMKLNDEERKVLSGVIDKVVEELMGRLSVSE